MKNTIKISLSIFAIAMGSIFISEYSSSADGNASGALPGYCGDPAGGGVTCNTSGCHTGAPVTSETGWITSNIPLAGYTPDSTYTITATATRAGRTRFGFEISPQNSAGVFQGTLINTETATKLVGINTALNKYITHTIQGISAPTGSRIWSFDWTAPATGNGPVTFYGAFNAANALGNLAGDTIITSTTLVSENLTGIDELKNISNYISIYPNPVSGNFYINNSSTESGITSLTITDINGRLIKVLRNVAGYQPVNMEELAKGFYFVRIETSRGDVIKKIVKE